MWQRYTKFWETLEKRSIFRKKNHNNFGKNAGAMFDVWEIFSKLCEAVCVRKF